MNGLRRKDIVYILDFVAWKFERDRRSDLYLEVIALFYASTFSIPVSLIRLLVRFIYAYIQIYSTLRSGHFYDIQLLKRSRVFSFRSVKFRNRYISIYISSTNFLSSAMSSRAYEMYYSLCFVVATW